MLIMLVKMNTGFFRYKDTQKPCHKGREPDVAGCRNAAPVRYARKKYCLWNYTKMGGVKFVLSSVYYIVQPVVSYPLVR